MPQPSRNSRKPKSPKGGETKAKAGKSRPQRPSNDAPRPNIYGLNTRIARDNARVSRFMESLANHIDLIVDAASADDWQEVARQAEYLAGGGAVHGCQELSIRAAELAETIKNPYNAATARRQIVRLIGACGRAHQADAAKA